jgi:hypothetical protein
MPPGKNNVDVWLVLLDHHPESPSIALVPPKQPVIQGASARKLLVAWVTEVAVLL